MVWLFKVKNKYYVTRDFDDDLCNLSDKDISEAVSVDELIAEALVLLCNKGYITKYSCSGHPFNNCYYDIMEEESDKKALDIEKHIMVTRFEDTDAKIVCDIDSEIDDEAYIFFANEYNFLNLPETWDYQERKLSKRITAETVLDFYQQVIDAIRKLTDWIHELPDINIQS